MGKINIRSTVHPPYPLDSFSQWSTWMIQRNKDEWKKKMRESYGKTDKV